MDKQDQQQHHRPTNPNSSPFPPLSPDFPFHAVTFVTRQGHCSFGDPRDSDLYGTDPPRQRAGSSEGRRIPSDPIGQRGPSVPPNSCRDSDKRADRAARRQRSPIPGNGRPLSAPRVSIRSLCDPRPHRKRRRSTPSPRVSESTAIPLEVFLQFPRKISPRERSHSPANTSKLSILWLSHSRGT